MFLGARHWSEDAGELRARMELVTRAAAAQRAGLIPAVWIDGFVVRVRPGVMGEPEVITWDELAAMVDKARRPPAAAQSVGQAKVAA